MKPKDQRNITSHLESIAKVINKSVGHHQKLAYFIVTLLGIVMVVLIGKQHINKNDKQDMPVLTQVKSQALKDNLQQINKMKHDKVPKIVVDQVALHENDLKDEAPYSERMSSPTTMYELSYPLEKNSIKSERINGDEDIKQHSEHMIAQGEFIHATLMVAISSDLPGMISAIVSQPVYSYTGRHILIPAGSRVIGEYSSATTQGQSRIFILWNCIILPNGQEVDLASPGVDAIGRAGEGANHANRHFWQRFGEASLLSIIGTGVSTYDVHSNDQYNSESAYRMAIAESLQESANETLQHTVAIKPTLHRYQGSKLNIFVSKNIEV